LGAAVQQAVNQGVVRLELGFKSQQLARRGDQVVVTATDGRTLVVDEIVAATGFRPDLAMLRELRLAMDETTESPVALAPLIDPNVHSCGSVPPHGVEELKHPETDVYIVGMKSYGRAPTFLMLTGYEQVRSVVAALAGDWAAAREVHLVLPETGVCSTDRGAGETSSSVCCGAAAEAPPALIQIAPSLIPISTVGIVSANAADACCDSTCCSTVDAVNDPHLIALGTLDVASGCCDSTCCSPASEITLLSVEDSASA
jgi:hypothetical protein